MGNRSSVCRRTLPMGWMETCAVEERMRFMVAVEKGEESFAAICRRFDVSRRIGYKWLARFEEEGVAGLLDRSRAPLHHPQAIVPKIAERCLEVRRRHRHGTAWCCLARLQADARQVDRLSRCDPRCCPIVPVE